MKGRTPAATTYRIQVGEDVGEHGENVHVGREVMAGVSREDDVGDEEQLHEEPAECVGENDGEDHARGTPFALADRLATGAAEKLQHQTVENDDDGQRKRVEKYDEAQPVETGCKRQDLYVG